MESSQSGTTEDRQGVDSSATAASSTADEMVEWIDEQGDVIELVPRSRMRRANLRHRSAAVVVLSTDGQRLLVHRRSEHKDLRPGWWDVCAGGVAGVGESFEHAARRELAEELGVVDVPLGFLGRAAIDAPDSRELTEVYVTSFDGPFHFSDGEIAEARFVDRAELMTMLDEVAFLPTCAALVLPLVAGFEPDHVPGDVDVRFH